MEITSSCTLLPLGSSSSVRIPARCWNLFQDDVSLFYTISAAIGFIRPMVASFTTIILSNQVTFYKIQASLLTGSKLASLVPRKHASQWPGDKASEHPIVHVYYISKAQ